MKTFDTPADKWQARYAIAKENQGKMFRRFAKWYDQMYASVNNRDYAPWRSKVFIPVIASKAWSMMAKLQSLQPGFEVGLYGQYDNDPDAQDKAEKAQWKLEYDWNNPDFDEPMTDKLFGPLADALVTGTGIAKVPWCTEEKKSYKRPILNDKGYTDLSKQKVTTTQAGYNDLVPVSIFDFFVAPGSTNLYSAEWIMIKSFKTLQSLEDEGLYDKNALAKLKDIYADSDEFAQEKKSRNRMTDDADPINSDDSLAQIELYECYEKSSGTISAYAVGGSKDGESHWLQLSSKKNPYWHGKYPLVAFYVRKRPYDIWGQGIFEDTERMSNAIMDVFNHFVDSYNLSVNGMVMKQEGEEFRYIVAPGGELTYRQNPPQQFKFADPNAATFQTIMSSMESAIEDSTISQYAEGTPNSPTDKTSGTASGIARLQEAAGDKLSSMKANHATALRTIGQFWLSNNQQYLSAPATVQGKVDGQPGPVQVTPADMQIDTILRINDASMEPVSNADKLNQYNAYLQQLQGLQAASVEQAQQTKWTTKPLYFDYPAIVEDLAQKTGEANWDKIVLSNQEVEQAMQASQAPLVMPNERITITPSDLKASELAQLLQRNGITPDPSRQQSGVTPSDALSDVITYKDAPPDIQAQMEEMVGLQPSMQHLNEAAANTTEHATALVQPQLDQMQQAQQMQQQQAQQAQQQAQQEAPTNGK